MTNDPILLFVQVLEEHQDDRKWDDALFGRIKRISNTKVGDVGEVFIQRLCGLLLLSFSFPQTAEGRRRARSPWDVKIEDIEFELKTATEDTNRKFQFNHIRLHRPYHALLCLGVSPSNLYFGIWSKADIATGKAGTLATMEKGANASYKLTKGSDQLCEIALFEQEIRRFAKAFKQQNQVVASLHAS